MIELTALSDRLKACPVPMTQLSKLSGVARPTILAIRDGETSNPGILTVQRIEDALKQVEAQHTPAETAP